jgi:predicted ABC-type transport system involved in lysophospholipase L1 biosynthesis ATPase subunit
MMTPCIALKMLLAQRYHLLTTVAGVSICVILMRLEYLTAIARRAGKSVVIVTHDRRIEGYADRIATMEDGRLRW